jgi:hypothetical protein
VLAIRDWEEQSLTKAMNHSLSAESTDLKAQQQSS